MVKTEYEGRLAGSVGVAWDSILGCEFKPHAGCRDDLKINFKKLHDEYETAVNKLLRWR